MAFPPSRFQPQQPPQPEEGFEDEPYGYDDQSYDDQSYGQQMPQGMMPGQSMPYPNQSAQLLQWLLNFKKEVTLPLRHLWRGHEMNELGQWVEDPEQQNPVMNERGITWSISLIESYINPVYMMSNYSENDLNWSMKQLGRVVYNNLCARYKDFGLNKLDIQRVANEIISKVHAILLGCRNNGYRMFLSSSHHVQENYMQQAPLQDKGFMPTLKGFLQK